MPPQRITMPPSELILFPPENRAKTAHTKITKLNAEITKLRAITAFTNAELEESLQNQRYALKYALQEEEERFHQAERRLQSVKDQVQRKEESNQYLQQRLDMKDRELHDAMEDGERLKKNLDVAGNESIQHEIKMGQLKQIISSKVESIDTLLTRQTSVESSISTFEQNLKEGNQMRVNKLKAMLDDELEMQKKLEDFRVLSASYEKKKTLKDSIANQKKELELLKDILELAIGRRDEKEDEGNSKSLSPRLLIWN